LVEEGEMSSDDDEGATSGEGKLAKLLFWALRVEPEDCIAMVAKKRRTHPDVSPRELAASLVTAFSRKGALEGFGTGLASNPIAVGGAAAADAFYMLRQYAAMNAAIGYLADPAYFEDPDWKHDGIIVLGGASALGQAFRTASVAFAEQGSKKVIKKYLSKSVLKALQRTVLKWLGKKVTQRAIITKTVPLIGGLIGGAWNYTEMRIVGARIAKYHFDDELE
jgi:hypothetical protein